MDKVDRVVLSVSPLLPMNVYDKQARKFVLISDEHELDKEFATSDGKIDRIPDVGAVLVVGWIVLFLDPSTAVRMVLQLAQNFALSKTRTLQFCKELVDVLFVVPTHGIASPQPFAERFLDSLQFVA